MLLGEARLFVGQTIAVDDDTHAAGEAARRFAAALREARSRYGRESGQGDLTQKQFATMLGISGDRPEERYRLYESAKREPPLWILVALRRVTGYSLDDLIAQLPAGRRLNREHNQRSGDEPSRRRELLRQKGPEPPRPPLGGRVKENRFRRSCAENVRELRAAE